MGALWAEKFRNLSEFYEAKVRKLSDNPHWGSEIMNFPDVYESYLAERRELAMSFCAALAELPVEDRVDPTGPPVAWTINRVIRGGGYDSPGPYWVRSAYRDYVPRVALIYSIENKSVLHYY